jgi:hypothetical protein
MVIKSEEIVAIVVFRGQRHPDTITISSLAGWPWCLDERGVHDLSVIIRERELRSTASKPKRWNKPSMAPS